jgi:hypothetical protein
MRVRRSAKPADPNQLLTVDELAAWLKMSGRSARELCRERNRAHQKIPIPVVRFSNRALRFSRESITEWLRQLQATK